MSLSGPYQGQLQLAHDSRVCGHHIYTPDLRDLLDINAVLTMRKIFRQHSGHRATTIFLPPEFHDRMICVLNGAVRAQMLLGEEGARWEINGHGLSVPSARFTDRLGGELLRPMSPDLEGSVAIFVRSCEERLGDLWAQLGAPTSLRSCVVPALVAGPCYAVPMIICAPEVVRFTGTQREEFHWYISEGVRESFDFPVRAIHYPGKRPHDAPKESWLFSPGAFGQLVNHAAVVHKNASGTHYRIMGEERECALSAVLEQSLKDTGRFTFPGRVSIASIERCGRELGSSLVRFVSGAVCAEVIVRLNPESLAVEVL